MSTRAGAGWSLLLVLGALPAAAAEETDHIGTVKETETRFQSAYLDGEIVVQPGVFHPVEAEQTVLPLLKAHAELFRDKTVLEIGTGSGINSLYAAHLGARKVVATDINEAAIETARRNAAALGFAERMEVRQVPLSDPSAYAVIRPDETFDVVLSNPPYSLDLDADVNDAVTDTGDLGFSIVRGLETHLAPEGVALLLYASLFYHEVMVKFARHEGFAVRNDPSPVLTPWEAGTLFNAYLARLLEREGLARDAFRFDWQNEPAFLRMGVRPSGRNRLQRLRWALAGEDLSGQEPLFEGEEPGLYPGWIAIRRGDR